MLWKKLWNLAVIILIYGCTGSAAAFVSGKLSGLLGLRRWSLAWWIAWLLVIFPLYNVLLLGFAFIFGRYDSFRARQAKILAKLKGWITRRKEKPLAKIER